MNHATRLLALSTLLALVVPTSVAAQPRILGGGGITSPIGSLADAAESGYHARLGVELGIPTLPVAVRLDGSYHSLSEANSTFQPTKVLGGGLNVVFTLPGVGLVPYVLGGIGRYNLETGLETAPVDETTNGFQAGFGVNLGAIAFGGFAEIRLVQVNGTVENFRYVPVTVGFRM